MASAKRLPDGASRGYGLPCRSKNSGKQGMQFTQFQCEFVLSPSEDVVLAALVFQSARRLLIAGKTKTPTPKNNELLSPPCLETTPIQHSGILGRPGSKYSGSRPRNSNDADWA